MLSVGFFLKLGLVFWIVFLAEMLLIEHPSLRVQVPKHETWLICYAALEVWSLERLWIV